MPARKGKSPGKASALAPDAAPWAAPGTQVGCCNAKRDALDTRDVALERRDGGVTDPKTSAASADCAKAQDGALSS